MSNDSINFSDLWNKQLIAKPNQADIQQRISKLKNKGLIQLFTITALLGITSAFIIWIWINYNPEMLTTKAGIVLILLAMAIFSVARNRQYPLLKQLDDAESNRDYLNNLMKLKKSEQFIHTTLLNGYFIMLATGLLLYLIEATQKMSMSETVLTYAAITIWFLFAWLYLRPKQIRKQQALIDEIIQKIEIISEQMD